MSSAALSASDLNLPLRVCVFCGSRLGLDPAFAESARQTALEIARRGMHLVFGGGGTGLMGITARTALDNGVPVTGIIPTFLMNQETPVESLTECIVVADMHERKAKMAELSDLFVVLPGSIGTIEEASEILTGNWLGLYHKPLGFLNVNGYYDHFLAFFKEASRAGMMPEACLTRFIADTDPAKLLDRLLAARTGAVPPLNADCFSERDKTTCGS